MEAGTLVAQPILRKLHNLGYYLLPRTHADSPGHSGLLVLLHEGPRPDVAFVPHSLQTRIVGQDGTIHWATFEAGTTFPSVRSVVPGKMILRDENGNEVEFFVFGGSLTAGVADGDTVYSFYSRPPVLPVSRTYHNVATHLAVEVEVLLAEQRAALLTADQAFLGRLVDADAFRLYLSCLDAILRRYTQVPDLRRHYNDFYHALLAEKGWLQETKQWPQSVPSLATLLHLEDGNV
jgi:hypothetical protein